MASTRRGLKTGASGQTETGSHLSDTAIPIRGRYPRRAHAIDDNLAVLDKHGADGQTQKDVLAIVYSLKGEIMRK